MDEKQSKSVFCTDRFSEDFRCLLPELDNGQTEMLIDMLSELQIDIIKPPATGLIMINSRDCFDMDFHLGEILVTTAEVAVSGIQGHATVMGDEPAKALLAASVNAAIRSGQVEPLVSIAEKAEALKKDLVEKQRQETLLTAATKVHFESMAKEEEL